MVFLNKALVLKSFKQKTIRKSWILSLRKKVDINICMYFAFFHVKTIPTRKPRIMRVLCCVSLSTPRNHEEYGTFFFLPRTVVLPFKKEKTKMKDKQKSIKQEIEREKIIIFSVKTWFWISRFSVCWKEDWKKMWSCSASDDVVDDDYDINRSARVWLA